MSGAKSRSPVIARRAAIALLLLAVAILAACSDQAALDASPVTAAPTATAVPPAPAGAPATAVEPDSAIGVYPGIPRSRDSEGRHSLGEGSAPVTLVMFSDFLCTACALHVLETEPPIVEAYVRPGKVRLMYRHLTQLGERSELLAEAAECAADQERFWEMRLAIYRRYNQLYTETLAGIEAAAAEAGVDVAALRACLESETHRERVRAAAAAALAEGVRSRPVFVIGDRRIIGAQPFSVFRAALDRALGL